ncbi:hypothetical protein [Deinococcus navajonensis]|uniref:Uncharacterized protein n=1 Tax=Deinococcus navajonensis TaxID=309884 RepID=A0ABV8XNV9_9DEIO
MKRLRPLIQKCGEDKLPGPANLEVVRFHGPRKGGLGLLCDLHDLWRMAQEVQLC